MLGERAAKVAGELQALAGPRVHGGLVDRRALLALVLGRVHRQVGVADQLLRAHLPVAEGDADAGVHEDVVSVQVERKFLAFVDAVGHFLGREGGIGALNQHHELVSAEAGSGVGAAHALGQAQRELAQHLVAGRMAERVVDGLEVVEVDEEDRHLVLVAAQALERVRHAILEQQAVGQAGQRVVEGLPAQLVLHLGPVLIEPALAVGERALRPLGPEGPHQQQHEQQTAAEGDRRAGALLGTRRAFGVREVAVGRRDQRREARELARRRRAAGEGRIDVRHRLADTLRHGQERLEVCVVGRRPIEPRDAGRQRGGRGAKLRDGLSIPAVHDDAGRLGLAARHGVGDGGAERRLRRRAVHVVAGLDDQEPAGVDDEDDEDGQQPLPRAGFPARGHATSRRREDALDQRAAGIRRQIRGLAGLHQALSSPAMRGN